MIVAPKGKVLLEADLSQAETWVVAYRSNCKPMKEAINYGVKKNGTDIHSITSKSFYDLGDKLPTEQMRFVGKKGNHQCSYMGGDYKLAESINKESDKPPYVTITIKESKRIRAIWLELYHEVTWWWKEVEEKIKIDRTLTTVYRRRRVFYGQFGPSLVKEAVAFEPQSTIGDHLLGAVQPEIGVKGGLKEVYKKLIIPYKENKIINTAHDSCILEIPKEIYLEIAPQVMNELKRPLLINGEEFVIPVDMKIGTAWGELEEIKI